ncbi:MAG: winged helix-turn-helix transcriptional regulator, partial [Bacteroidales bacterium]
MYKRKIPLDLSCGTTVLLQILSGKWKPCIIDAVRETGLRPSQIHKLLEEATPRVLNQQIKELEEHGVLQKNIIRVTPPHVEYSLTELGESILPVMDMMD